MGPDPIYDTIGVGYSATRRDDPRIAQDIASALGDARTVLNVGAGTGSYEPADRAVLAVEPSRRMIDQRSASAAPVVQATAEALPFASGSFDAALAVLTIHHWSDPDGGLAELRRVARRVVLLTFDPHGPGFWLTERYFPQFLEEDRRRFHSIADLRTRLRGLEVRPVSVPFDCQDGFLGAFWRRPAAYLDPAVRRGISSFSAAAPGSLTDGLERLAADLDSGRWLAEHRDLLELEEIDLGYRLLISG